MQLLPWIALFLTVGLVIPAAGGHGPDASEPAPPARPAPPATQTQPTTARSPFRSVAVEEAAALIRAAGEGKGPTALDVRTLGEYQAGHVVGSLHLLPGQPDEALREAVKDLDPHRSYVLYCVAGARAGTMAKRLANLGFTDLVVLDGGYKQLKAAGLLVKEPPATTAP